MPTNRASFGVAVVDDLLYIIGGYTPFPYSGSFTGYVPGVPLGINEQYVPIGYQDALLSGTGFSLSNITIAVVALILIVGIAGGLVLYFNKKKRGCIGDVSNIGFCDYN
jgi:hypothetical protein